MRLPSFGAWYMLVPLLAVTALSGCADQELHAAMTRDGPVLHLPRAMRKVLDEYAPGFQPWTLPEYGREAVETWSGSPGTPLFAVIGDFNGDSVKDIALEGRNRQHHFSFVILSRYDTFYVLELFPREARSLVPSDWKKPDFLMLQPPGVVESPPGLEPGPLQLETDAIHSIYDSQASVIYYWGQRGFLEYATGD